MLIEKSEKTFKGERDDWERRKRAVMMLNEHSGGKGGIGIGLHLC